MHKAARTTLRALLSVLLGLFSLPTLGFGGYLLVCLLRIHTSDLYYSDYPYAFMSVAFLAAGLLSIWATLYGAWRRSFYGMSFALPVFLGLAAMISIPDLQPRDLSGIADTNYLSGVHAFFGVWFEKNHRFPADESEFKQALWEGPAAWQYRVEPVPPSRYKQRGRPLPYQIVVATGATGPRVTNISPRPGVIYYCVSSDLQEFWVTMTRLQTNLADAASLKPSADLTDERYWIVHAAGRDYPPKKP
jgi:hypothetical protein